MHKPSVVVSLEGMEPLHALHVASCLKESGIWGFHVSSLLDDAGLDIVHILRGNGNVMVDHRILGGIDMVSKRTRSWFEHGANIVTIDIHNSYECIRIAQDIAEEFDDKTPDVDDDFMVSVSLMREDWQMGDFLNRVATPPVHPYDEHIQMQDLVNKLSASALESMASSVFYDARYYDESMSSMGRIEWVRPSLKEEVFKTIGSQKPHMVVLHSSWVDIAQPVQSIDFIHGKIDEMIV